MQIEETLAKARQAAARRDDAGVLRAVGLQGFIQTEQDPSLMRLLLFRALEGHPLAHTFFETKVRSLHEFLGGSIDECIAEGAFHPVNPLVAAWGFIGIIVHSLWLNGRRRRVTKRLDKGQWVS